MHIHVLSLSFWFIIQYFHYSSFTLKITQERVKIHILFHKKTSLDNHNFYQHRCTFIMVLFLYKKLSRKVRHFSMINLIVKDTINVETSSVKLIALVTYSCEWFCYAIIHILLSFYIHKTYPIHLILLNFIAIALRIRSYLIDIARYYIGKLSKMLKMPCQKYWPIDRKGFVKDFLIICIRKAVYCDLIPCYHMFRKGIYPVYQYFETMSYITLLQYEVKLLP